VVQVVFGLFRTALSFGKGSPFRGGRPRWPGRRARAGLNRLASSRNRVIMQTRRWTAASSSRAANPLSPTKISVRSGNQRLVCRIACRAQAVRVLCRLPWAWLHRAEGARMVRNGSPSPCGPRNWHDHHQRQPAQAAGLDEVSLRGADGITIDAARADPSAPAALDRVIDADHHRPGGQQAVQHMEQQSPGQRACIPARPVQDLMIAAEAGVIAQPHDAQRLGDGSFARRQHGAGDQDQNVLPDRGGKEWTEDRQPRRQDRRNQGRGGRRDGVRTIRFHRSLGIERSCRRKSLSIRDDTSDTARVYRRR